LIQATALRICIPTRAF